MDHLKCHQVFRCIRWYLATVKHSVLCLGQAPHWKNTEGLFDQAYRMQTIIQEHHQLCICNGERAELSALEEDRAPQHKTENMLLNDKLNLKSTDFGMAYIKSNSCYMVSEVLDRKPYNHKCDVYNFNICIWEIYCYKMPCMDVSFINITLLVLHKHMRPEIPKCCLGDMACIMRRG
ncbi:serine/threonine/tyrosine-protein kinase HT1-like [Oryza brachyantha]|uniref:Serine-threonine/tyrosine-protein kinase catalytic domain-containing protein n=1 Tax=Oryza brachyantha TaxID=4533 RepID=J3LBP0_ORYBR|nr:serine/threonine/tyrosine-protein kinase HT1-like [Oryza brachyantha]